MMDHLKIEAMYDPEKNTLKYSNKITQPILFRSLLDSLADGDAHRSWKKSHVLIFKKGFKYFSCEIDRFKDRYLFAYPYCYDHTKYMQKQTITNKSVLAGRNNTYIIPK